MGGRHWGHASDGGMSTTLSHLLGDSDKVRDEPTSAGPTLGVPTEGLRHGQ